MYFKSCCNHKLFSPVGENVEDKINIMTNWMFYMCLVSSFIQESPAVMQS